MIVQLEVVIIEVSKAESESTVTTRGQTFAINEFVIQDFLMAKLTILT